MTLATPPYALQGSTHGAQLFREAISSLITPSGGLVQAGDLAIAQHGTPNMSVDVGAGRVWVPGTSLATVNPGGGAYYPQGLYFTENDAAVNLGISAADPTNPRLDQVVVRVQDAAYVGVTNSVSLAVLTGTPTGGASLANLVGLASLPVSTLLLGYVLVPANATTIVTADILNVAAIASPGTGNIPAWQPRTFYPGGYVVQQSGLLYAALTAFISGATFNAANWSALTAAGTELASAQITSSFVSSGFAEQDVTGLSVTFTAPARPVMLEAWSYAIQQNGSGGVPQLFITDSSNNHQAIAQAGTLAAGASGDTLIAKARISGLTAGTSYTYKLRASSTAGSFTVVSAAGFASYLRAEQA